MTALTEIVNRPALSIGQVMTRGEVGAVEVTEHLLGLIEKQPSPIFLNVTKKRALREARAAEDRLRAGNPLSPLDGVPIGWKDLIDMEGEPTTAGSDLYRTSPPAERDAPIVKNAAAAGMVSLGKLNLTEFAYSGLGLNPHFGTPVNPNDTENRRAPGGSSSGSAVAVASGLCPCAIGTDTGGSVRIPAAFNGLVGYKSSENRIDKEGVFALSPTLDTVGPIGRSVADCAALDAVMRGVEITDPGVQEISSLTFFVPQNVVVEDLESAVSENFEASITALELAGARIIRGRSSELDRAATLAAELGTITAAEAYVVHKDLVESEAVLRIDQRVVDRIMIGKSISASSLQLLRKQREDCMQAIEKALNGAFLLMPTSPHVAPEIAPLEADIEAFHRTNLRTLRNTALGNFLNLPGLAIPNGTGLAGLPTSLLVSTTRGDDDRLLAAGSEIEKTIRAAI